MQDFSDKVVLITGTGRDEGPAIARAFADQGASLALHDVTPIHVDRIVAEITARGGRARAYVGDVVSKLVIQSVLEDVLDDWGRIDGLMNNLRVRPRASLLTMDEWDWRRTLDSNLGGPFYFMQSVGRVMRDQRAGAMVTVIGDDQPAGEVGQRLAYMVTQLGLISLTREAAAELAAYNVRVNAISRSLAALTMAAGLRSDDESLQRNLTLIPRSVRTDLVRLAVYLTGDSASGVTGVVMDAPFLV